MLGHLRNRREAGDTLIEVLFAVTVFSLVVVTSLTLMNQGTSASIRSLQITLVRQEIDSQADTLRFLNSTYVAAYYPGYVPAALSPAGEYQKIKLQAEAAGLASVSQFGGGTTTCQTAPGGSFILNTRKATYQTTNLTTADTFAQVVYDGAGSITAAQGMWIEAIRSLPANGTVYTDFHIRACWYAPGTNQAMNLGTIVRLYEPTN
ncbi:MAG: type IV pilus modification PilV family protein [Candidatus Saccharimonadaceae bacterium]